MNGAPVRTAATEPAKAPEPAAAETKSAAALRAPVPNIIAEPQAETSAAPQATPEPAIQTAQNAEPVAQAETKPAEPVAAAAAPEPPIPSRESLTASPVVATAESPKVEAPQLQTAEAPQEPKIETPEPVKAAEVVAVPAAAAAPAAEEKAASAKTGPRHFAANRHDARVVIEAKEASWLRISDAEGKLVFMRNMQPGETYRVPNRAGLQLETGNAKGLAFEVDGKAVPPLAGMLRRSVSLDPDALTNGTAVAARQEPAEKPKAAEVATAKPTAESVVAPDAPKPVAAAKPQSSAPKAEASDAAPNGLLTATLPGPLPSARPVDADPVVPAVAPVLNPPAAPTARKAAPAAHVAPAVPQHAAPSVKPDAVQPVALAAAPTRAAVAQDNRGSPLVTSANAVTPGGVISAATSRIGLEINKGTLVRLTQPAATVFVADPEIADIQMKSPGLVYVFGRKAGETALYAVDDRERVVLNTTLVVNHNVSRLRQALRAVAPDAEVDAISVDDSLILTGVVQTPVEAENIRAVAARFAPQPGALINQIRVVAPNQINLRVRIAEVSKETLKQFGINWESIARLGSNVLFGIGAGRDFITGGVIPRAGDVNTLALGYRNGSQDINAAIDALATEGLITVLAEPNLTALSGETASFLAGGEFPIPIAQGSSNNSTSISVEFKTFGVGLAFTPNLLDAGRINLRVRPEVSQLSSAGAVTLSGFTIPALTTRRAETTVELGSGQSFVIAGLLQNNTTQDISKVPLLGDLPVLGALFKSDRFRRNESELVIIVTPYIVRPISANRIASPTDGYVAPSDVERILGGQSYKQQLPDNGEMPRTKDGQGLVGPTGFQLD
jgi:pilus assembly protein CpaC